MEISVWLQEKRWTEVEEHLKNKGDVIIVPVGSTEQHGPHMPLGTDTMVAEVLAEEAAQQTDVLVAPPLWYGWSPHHMVLPGTVTVRPEVLVEVLYDILESLSRHGFKKFVTINGHRLVNISWMQLAAERAQRNLGIKVVIFDPAYMSKEIVAGLGFGHLGHSDEIETSHMCYKHPELVRLDLARDNPIPPPAPSLYSVDPFYRGDTLCYVPSTIKDMQKSVEAAGGTTGEPSKSSAEKGKVYHEHVVANLVKVIGNLKNLKL